MQTNPPATSSNEIIRIVLIVVVLLVVVCIVIPCCIIAILALMGPSVANVFSRVTSGLGAP